MTNEPRPRRALGPDEAPLDHHVQTSDPTDPDAIFRRDSFALHSTTDPYPERGIPPEGGWFHLPTEEPQPSAAHAARAAHGGQAEARSSSDRLRRHLRSSFGLTLASTVLPGSGLLGARSLGLKMLGAVTSLATLVGLGFLGYKFITDPTALVALATPDQLPLISAAAIALGLVWIFLILLTHLATRPHGLGTGKRIISGLLVTTLTFMVAAPTAVGSRYIQDASSALNTAMKKRADIQAQGQLTLAPPSAEDPWQDIPRLNILLLGSDGNKGREEMVKEYSIRTDTIMVASIDTQTGDTILVQIPRNVPRTPFPEGSEMAEAFPNGFRGEEGDYMINEIWAQVELNYTDLMKGSTFRGADALKQGVEGITGLEINYFLMLDTDGLEGLVDAMGGVTVNINERVPVGGNTDKKIKPSRYLEIEKDAHLNGTDALWFARGRYGSDDYHRMARQSCLVNAIIKQANPTNLLSRFEAIAYAGAQMVETDIPQEDLPAMITLALRMKDAKTTRVVFTPGVNGYNSNHPDFEAMRAAVTAAVSQAGEKPSPTPSTPTPTGSASASQSAKPTPTATASNESGVTDGNQDVTDACAWQGE